MNEVQQNQENKEIVRLPADVIPLRAQESDVIVQKVNDILDSADIPPIYSAIKRLKFTKHGLVGEKKDI